jgi:phospholipase C
MTATPAHASLSTATPIEHVISIVGESPSFDHLYATYTPKAKGETVMNLLSQGIVRADGSPGPNFIRGQQYQIVSPHNGRKFFISADMASKQLYATLPAPDVGGVGKVSPYAGILSIPGRDPGLPLNRHGIQKRFSVILAVDDHRLRGHHVPDSRGVTIRIRHALRPRA